MLVMSRSDNFAAPEVRDSYRIRESNRVCDPYGVRYTCTVRDSYNAVLFDYLLTMMNPNPSNLDPNLTSAGH